MIEGRLVGDGLGLHTLGVQHPLRHPQRLTPAVAAHRCNAGLLPAEGHDAVRVFVDFRYRFVPVVRVVPHHRADRVAFTHRGTDVGDLTIHDVGARHDLDRGGRHVTDRYHGVGTPVGHAPENTGQVGQGDLRVFLGSEQGIDGEPWLHPPVAIRYQLIRVLGDAVQQPLIDVLDFRADYRVQRQVHERPRRVVRPRLLELAVPDAGVGACVGVVVRWNADQTQLHIVGAGRHRGTEQLGVDGDAHQRHVRVSELLVDYFGKQRPGDFIL